MSSFLLCSISHFSQSLLLEITIENATDQSPIPGALVFVQEMGQSAEADTAGRIALALPAPGSYSLTIFAENFATKTMEAQLERGEQLAIQLNPLSLDIETIELKAN